MRPHNVPFPASECHAARDGLASELQAANGRQAETGALLAGSKAAGEQAAQELQRLHQAAAAAAAEAAATQQQLEQQLSELQEAQV